MKEGERTVKVFQHERQLRTTGGLAVRDITEEVSEAVRDSGVIDGIACVYSPHTTCCVRVNEFESGFLEDFANLLKRLVPSETYYAHDDWDRRTENICEEDMDFGNGHSHCMAMLLGTAGESIPVRAGEPVGAEERPDSARLALERRLGRRVVQQDDSVVAALDRLQPGLERPDLGGRLAVDLAQDRLAEVG